MNPELSNVAPADLQLDPLSALVDETAAEANGDVGHWLRTAFRARKDGQKKETRALLEAAATRFPQEAHVLHDLGRLEEWERNWPAAERNWKAYTTMNPTVWWGFAELARALREQGKLHEADAVLAEAWERFPQEAAVGINHARMAEFLGDWPGAVTRWATVSERFHEKWEGLVGQARGLRLLGQPEAARALLVKAIARFPTEAGPLHDLVRLEEAERNWSKAEGGWRAYIGLDTSQWWAHVGLANTLREQGRMDEAEAQFADAQERFPEEAGVFMEHARLAEFRGDWPNAAARWKLVTELFPDRWEGLAGQARAQREQGQLDVARGFLVHAVDQFPAAPGPLHDLARLEEAERNWPAAERCWRAYVSLDPTRWWAHIGLANALLQQGQDSAAELILADQVGQLGHEPAVLIEYARIADRRGDWAVAQTRWGDVAARFPDRWEGICGQARSLRAQHLLTETEALLSEASDRFSGQDWLLLERAQLSEAQGDWGNAEATWRALIANGQCSWWFYWRLVQTECRQKNIQAACDTFAEAFAKFPGDLSIVVDFVNVLINEDYREPARHYIAWALQDEHEASAQDLIRFGQLAIRCEDIERATDVVGRLRLQSLNDADLAEQFRALEDALEMRIADLAQRQLDDPGMEPLADASTIETATAPLQRMSLPNEGQQSVPAAANGGSWLRRAARAIRSKPR